jgi:hypothetical protein
MIPFNGRFAQDYVYPLALEAYNAQTPPAGYTLGTDAFEILAHRASPMQPKQPALLFKPCRAAPSHTFLKSRGGTATFPFRNANSCHSVCFFSVSYRSFV